MRSNIFLHFLNRDSREIYGLYTSQPQETHFLALWQATNAAVLLCEEFCIIPPGFVVECDLAFSLLEQQSAFLREGLIRLPMREAGLSDFAEKKRSEYGGMETRYQGLFDDRRLDFLTKNAHGLMPRSAKMGEAISKGWARGPDTRARIWKPVKERLSSPTIEVVRFLPNRLLERESAVTWSAIEPLLPPEAYPAAQSLRNSVQHIYFKAYMDEFGLVVLRGAPLMHLDFMLPSEDRVYSYESFRRYLRAFHLHDILLKASAEVVCGLKLRPGTTRFLDAYAEFGRLSKGSSANIEFGAGLVAEESRFDWRGFSLRHPGQQNWPEIEVVELAHALGEVGTLLQQRFGLPARLGEITPAPVYLLGKLRIAFLSASPFDEASADAKKYRIGTDKEFRELEASILVLPTAGRVELRLFPAADFSTLLRALNEFRPHIIHFSGHGWAGGILMETSSFKESGGTPVPFDILSRALSATSEPPRLVVLNACDTAKGAQALLDAVPLIIAMSEPIGDVAAYEFSEKFYAAICAGQSVAHAKAQACASLEIVDKLAAKLPRILARKGVDPATCTFKL